MPKTAIISWRIKPDRRRALESEARREGITLPELLNRMIGQFLEARRRDRDENTEQRRLHAAAAKFIGTISSGDPSLSENVSAKVRSRLRQRRKQGRL
jgi:hypothetical protein